MHRLHPFPEIRSMLRRLLLAVATGIAAALAVWLFRQTLLFLENAVLGSNDGSLVAAADALPLWRRIVTPAMGGLLAGLVLWLWQRHSVQHPHGPDDYMEAIESGDGQLDTQRSLVKSGASLIVVSTGSAIGREGAMILLASLAAAKLCRYLTPREEWKLWLACGAAAGMASAYHAPLAGSLFIAEVLFGTLMLASLGPVVIAAVTAQLVTLLLSNGKTTLYQVIPLAAPSPSQYLEMALLGVVIGCWGALLLRLMCASRKGFQKIAPLPLRLMAGGAIVGCLSAFTPMVWGNGYSVVQAFLSQPPLFGFIGLILLCKLLAVLASSCSGAPGGVFTPTLFIGVATGLCAGRLWGMLHGVNTESVLYFGLTGMAALLAATTHAPIMAALMVCEMTGEYTLLPALLLASVIASVLSRWLWPDSIYRKAQYG
ncbi:voltage-gated ClC-type chloride channel ClcB [Mangrovibacter plantisponsor]|uniref:CIC family chloride channel protein n=1 Tax=Mangrovibacter plantisponsor TaxID=451513 RepID=A0A317Q6S1_9ENTR|nr:voltage-gated ClC-type chloride channel ClcB [Mangrovibacter plantisponsor]PWW10982.1 CIC family chloride channel protein [Mangrovibacter plantisponsor]